MAVPLRFSPMKIEAIELVRFRLPFVTPFRTSFGVQTERDVILVHVVAEGVEGWGEDAAGIEPDYHYEFADASFLALRDHIAPRLVGRDVTAADVAVLTAAVQGFPMAKCALEAAVLDAECRAAGVSLKERLGGVAPAVRSGVSVGIHDTDAGLVETVAAYLAEGYARVKLKIEPGRDVGPVAAVRAAIGGDVLLQVDANGAYELGDADVLAQLDAFDLLLVEQPLAAGDLREHAQLAARLRTPLCLDESITSLRTTRDAIALGACRIVNIKAPRVGGYLEAVRIHDECVAAGLPVWCGGMLETGVGRAANLALASLPGFTLPADLSASRRYYRTDVTDPFELDRATGSVAVPTGAGIGVTPHRATLADLGAVTVTIPAP